MDELFIDTKSLGLLTHVNTHSGTKRCKLHGSKIECIFDTGIVMYVPEPIFKTMRFHLPEGS